jgi:hypothetical protein
VRNLFSKGSTVYFELDGKMHSGTVFAVDFRGGDVAEFFGLKGAGYTYDIVVESENMLYKHLPEHLFFSLPIEIGDEE